MPRIFQANAWHRVKRPLLCYCPYCGHCGGGNTFFTSEQIEYAKSIVFRKVTEAIHKDLKSLEFENKPQGLFGIGISMKVKESAPDPSDITEKSSSKPRSFAITAHSGTPSTAYSAGALTAGSTIHFKF